MATRKPLAPTSNEEGATSPDDASGQMARALERLAARVAAVAPPEESPAPEPDARPPAAYRQRFLTDATVRKRLASVEKNLQQNEQLGLFVAYPLNPGNEFPTLLTRLPIFRPTRHSHQRRLVNRELALEFQTPFGDGKRHGPPLTVRDEDTLIAITRLRSKRLYGRPQSLPVPIADIYAAQEDNGKVGVHCVVCSIDQINRELGLSNGGANYQRTFESVKRLGATTLELNLKHKERYLGTVKTGRMLPLINVQWQTFEDNGLFVILFPPVIAHWLEHEYTYLDWSIRKQLTDLGKCLHRFLSSQPKRYRGELSRIACTVGYDGPSRNTKPRFRDALDELQRIDWLKSYSFSGNGRSKPVILHITR